jgi:hypothetical protein
MRCFHHLTEIDPFKDGFFDFLIPRRESFDQQTVEKISEGQWRRPAIAS